MTKWITFPAAALLCAALARPRPEPPASRRPAPTDVEALPSEAAAGVDAPPAETPHPAALLETLARALLPSTTSEPALIGELFHFHGGANLQEDHEEELTLLGGHETMKAESRRAFNLGRYSRAERLCEWILEDAPQDVVAGNLQKHIRDARRERVLHFTQTRPSGRLDAETVDDLTPEEWREIADSILDDRRVSLDVQQASFERVLLQVRLDSGVPLVLEASTADRIRPDPPVTLRFTDVPLRQALRFVLDQVDPWLEMEVTHKKVVLIRNGRNPDR